MFNFSKKSLNKLKGVHPILVAIIVVSLRKSGYDFTVDFGVRTTEEQQEQWFKGRDKNGNIINPGAVVTKRDGIVKKSEHQAKDDGFGYAVDIYPYIQGKVDYADQYGKMANIAKIVKQVAADLGYNIVWGGDWTVKDDGLIDKPHFELR